MTYTKREWEELKTWWESLSEDDAADSEKASRYFLVKKLVEFEEELNG